MGLFEGSGELEGVVVPLVVGDFREIALHEEFGVEETLDAAENRGD